MRRFIQCLAWGGFFLGMGFLVELWWPLGDRRWGVFAIVWLIVVILTYILPVRWLVRIFPVLAHPELWPLRLRVMRRAKSHPERSEAEEDLGWEEEGIDDPKIEERHEREFRRALGLRKKDS